MTAKNRAEAAETFPGEASPGSLRNAAAPKSAPAPTPVLDFDVEIDFDQIVHDPVYRRRIIRRLNAAASR